MNLFLSITLGALLIGGIPDSPEDAAALTEIRIQKYQILTLNPPKVTATISRPSINPDVATGIWSAETSESVNTDSTRQNRARLMLLPIIFKSPDTGLAAGVLPQLVFRSSSTGNPSRIRMDSYYTQNRQYHLLLRSTYWFADNNRNLTGKVSLKEWPTSFYGIGKHASSGSQEKFTETLYEASVEATGRIAPGLFAGAGYGMRYGKLAVDDTDGALFSGSIPGSGTTFISGVHGVLRFDTRDNHFFPTSGSLHRVELFGAMKPLGSDYGFTRLTVDLRRYFSFHPAHALAVQAIGIATGGTVPFRMLPSAGSTLRGYSTVRHIDRNLVALQLEYRVVPVAWRLGMVAFGGVGEVFDRPADIQLNKLKFAAGIGLRYQFSRPEKINIRFDYGLGRDSSGDYIDLNEAF